MKHDESGHVVLLVTAGDSEEAHKIANALLGRKQAACVNIVPQVNSLFWWQGKLDSAQENLLIIKTRASLLDPATKTVKEIHSYEVPEIIALPVIGGNPDYLEWIDSELK
jgi:periplasmic divalent cation tolerance protein